MNQTIKYLIVFALCLLPITASAAGSIASGHITMMLLYDGHTGVLLKHTNLADPDSCGRSDYIILPDTYSHFSEAYSLLLASYMADKKISFTVSGCYQGIPAIQHISSVKG
ncbi:hypothetical protein FM037_24570 [Shewanella psychropiezotolerans]|uniref:Uncharacterized protein n=1 Tax=Shewanella psychropiezotolerans TaxID=2593655 RepID=A0ABX5X3C7_9GAMM|nr:hypothetical protein [Shewanella psychropiezotolerans]QDO85853.1 hypothetical protein FM037_24570 [Shewanella psychropiezotolerans]